jgi:transmembrane sensor
VTSKDTQIRDKIAEQASEWFVAHDAGPLQAEESAALVEWLRTSPLNVEEFLGVAAVARDLHMPAAHPESSVDTLLARAAADEEDSDSSFWSRIFVRMREVAEHRWQPTAVAAAALAIAALGVWLWNLGPVTRVAPPTEVAALRFETRHGEQKTYRLADNSLLHLNTDTAVSVRYSPTQRLLALTSGEVAFEVSHEPTRPFRVLAGPAEVVDVGTNFDVRLKPDSVVVTVIEGRVAVQPAARPEKKGTGAALSQPPRPVELGANQQVTVADGAWPLTPVSVDAQRATSWLHRQIEFENEPLERVAAEFNRYAAKPIEIVAPKLRQLQISGVFSTDDPEELIAFLRSLEGVQVDVTPTSIRVSQK